MPFHRQTNSDENANLLDSASVKECLLQNGRPNYGAVGEYPSETSTHLSEQTAVEDDGQDSEIDPKVRRRAMLAMPALAIGLFLASADQTIVISSYGKIGDEMQALNKASWIATTYVSKALFLADEDVHLTFLLAISSLKHPSSLSTES